MMALGQRPQVFQLKLRVDTASLAHHTLTPPSLCRVEEALGTGANQPAADTRQQGRLLGPEQEDAVRPDTCHNCLHCADLASTSKASTMLANLC